MIQLRKKDRTMLKVVTAMGACILIVLGMIFIDLHRGFRSSGQFVPIDGNNMFRSGQHGMDHDVTRDVSFFNVDYVNPKSDDTGFSDGSSNNARSSIINADMKAPSSSDADNSSFNTVDPSNSSSSIPEPSTVAIIGFAGAGLLLHRRRATRKAA